MHSEVDIMATNAARANRPDPKAIEMRTIRKKLAAITEILSRHVGLVP